IEFGFEVRDEIGVAGAAVEARFDGVAEGLDDARLELQGEALLNLLDDLVEVEPWAPGLLTSHRVEGFCHHENSSFERDLLAGEAVGVTAAVEAFVVVADN